MSKICPSFTDDGNYLRKHMLVDSSHILLQSLQNTNLNEAKVHEGTNKVKPNAILLKELQRQMMKYLSEEISIAIVWLYLMSLADFCYL